MHIPVNLYPATETQSISSNLLHKKDHSRIRYQRVSEATGKEVLAEEIVRGYEVERDNFVVISDDELKEASPRPLNRDLRASPRSSLIHDVRPSGLINQQLRPGPYESQSPGSRDKASGAASTHIGIASGSVNKMNGVRINAATMQKIAAAAITGIITSNKNNNNTSIDFTFKFSVSLDPLAPIRRSIPSQSYNGNAEILLRLAYDRKPRRKFAPDRTNLLWRYYRPSNAKVLNGSWRGLS